MFKSSLDIEVDIDLLKFSHIRMFKSNSTIECSTMLYCSIEIHVMLFYNASHVSSI